MRHAAALLALALVASACGGAGGAGGLRSGAPPADPVSRETGERLYQTGMQLQAEGDLVRAEEYFAAAIARGYPEDRVIGPLVRSCVAATRLRQALGYADPYLERHPSVWQLRFLVASILLGLGQEARAKDELVRVVREAPDEADPHYLLGIVTRELDGDGDAPRAELQRYLALAPTGRHADEVRSVLAGNPPAPPDHVTPADHAPRIIEHVIRPADEPAQGTAGGPQ